MNDQRPERRRFQFGLRKLLLWTAVVALYLGVLSLVRFEPYVSVSVTLYLSVVGVVRVRFGPRVGCICSVAVPLVPLLCLAGLAIIGEAVSGSIGPREAALWGWGLLFGLGACCVLGLVVFAFVELVLHAVDWADKLLETKAARKARRDEELERRWYQFSLRALLVVVLLVSVGMGLARTLYQARTRQHQARRHREAVQAIVKAGGAVLYDCEFDALRGYSKASQLPGAVRSGEIPAGYLFCDVYFIPSWSGWGPDAHLEHLDELVNLRGLNLYGTRVTDAGLEYLEGLTNLGLLSLGRTEVTDSGLEHLKGLTNLRELNLQNAQVTDVGLEHLKGLTSLEMISLADTPVTGAGLSHFKQLTNLKTLYLDAPRFSDTGLEHLGGLTKLELLGLDHTWVTDAGLEHLEELTRLRWLYLNGTEVTDTGLIHLKGLSNLRVLNLVGTRVTDAGLEHLKGLTSLQDLDLRRTQVTDAGIDELKKALPNCRIYH